MLVLIFFAAALGIGVVVLGIVGYDLFGRLSRLRRAAEEAQAELAPALESLRGQPSPGRHRAH